MKTELLIMAFASAGLTAIVTSAGWFFLMAPRAWRLGYAEGYEDAQYEMTEYEITEEYRGPKRREAGREEEPQIRTVAQPTLAFAIHGAKALGREQGTAPRDAREALREEREGGQALREQQPEGWQPDGRLARWGGQPGKNGGERGGLAGRGPETDFSSPPSPAEPGEVWLARNLLEGAAWAARCHGLLEDAAAWRSAEVGFFDQVWMPGYAEYLAAVKRSAWPDRLLRESA